MSPSVRRSAGSTLVERATWPTPDDSIQWDKCFWRRSRHSRRPGFNDRNACSRALFPSGVALERLLHPLTASSKPALACLL
jgi:hypothetical protein